MTRSDAVIRAAREGDGAALRQLLDEDPELAGARNAQGETPLLAALYRGHREAVKALLEAGPPLDIWEAAAVGQLERVRALLNGEPALVNACAPDGFYPPGLACFFGHPEVAEFLMERGADIHAAARNSLQVQPIHAAVAARLPHLVAALLARGADPGARQQAGWTPLHAAAQQGDEEVARLLLARGAAPRVPNDDGTTPLDLARAQGHTALVALLEAHVA